jgi:hypothetical protein
MIYNNISIFFYTQPSFFMQGLSKINFPSLYFCDESKALSYKLKIIYITYLHPTTVWQLMQYKSQTVCNPVVISLFSLGPQIILILKIKIS